MDRDSSSQLYYARESNYAESLRAPRPSPAQVNTGQTSLPDASSDILSITGRPENLILRALPPQLLRELDPFLTLVDLRNRQFLPQRNDSLNFVYFPITAVISDYSILADGRMVEIAVTGREGAVGLSTFLLDMHSAADITQVSQPGTAKRINAGTLTVLLGSNEPWQIDLKRCVALYVKQISQKAICNVYHPVAARMCTWLLMVQDRCGLMTLKLTHEYMAQVLGVFRPTVTDIAQKLRRDHVIDYTRGTISICDRKRVEDSACACYFAPDWAAN